MTGARNILTGMGLLTSSEAAQRLELSRNRITQLASAGILKGVKHGRDWMFTEKALRDFESLERVSHRPRKAATA